MNPLPAKLGKFFHKLPKPKHPNSLSLSYCFCKRIEELTSYLQSKSWIETAVPNMQPSTSLWHHPQENIAVSVIHNQFAHVVNKPDIKKLLEIT